MLDGRFVRVWSRLLLHRQKVIWHRLSAWYSNCARREFAMYVMGGVEVGTGTEWERQQAYWRRRHGDCGTDFSVFACISMIIPQRCPFFSRRSQSGVWPSAPRLRTSQPHRTKTSTPTGPPYWPPWPPPPVPASPPSHSCCPPASGPWAHLPGPFSSSSRRPSPRPRQTAPAAAARPAAPALRPGSRA